MRLTVLEPWYAAGLKFTCSQCGNCCTGAPGYVWISDEEVERLARHLELSVEQAIEKCCRRIGHRISLKEIVSPQGLYDCVFLKETRVGKEVRRVCSIYPVRPLQCRTWPFWSGNLSDRDAWEAAGKRCHGINAGSRAFTREQIEALRDAEDWPENPPTSASNK